MKKLSLVLILGMLLGLTACGGETTGEETTGTTTSQTESSADSDIEEATESTIDTVPEVEFDVTEADSSSEVQEPSESVNTMWIEYQGQKIDFPATVQELNQIGLSCPEELLGMEVATGENVSYTVNTDGGKIMIGAVNPSGETIACEECVIFMFGCGAEDVSMNGVVYNQTSYDEMIALLGKDVAERRDTAEEEYEVCETEGRAYKLAYTADSEGTENIWNSVSFSIKLSDSEDNLGTAGTLVLQYTYD